MPVYDAYDLPGVMTPAREAGPASDVHINRGSALWYGPPELRRPRCGRGHRERNMRWRVNDAKCYNCGYVESLAMIANNAVNSAAWNAWAKRAELEWLDEFGEVVELRRRPFLEEVENDDG